MNALRALPVCRWIAAAIHTVAAAVATYVL